MAKLNRFIKLNDRFDSQVFTFMLPQKIASEDCPESYSKDFTYGYHKWTAYFTRTDKHLGCFLKLQSACSGMKCQIDFSFTLLNREHFTRNEIFLEKGCVFSMEASQHGRKTFVGLHDLLERDFTQVAGDYLVELEMRKISCIFECYIRLPRDSHNHSRYAYETKLESPYFSYGLFDWSISVFPNEGSIHQDESIALQVHRHTSFDHICNVRYYVSIGENNGFQSEELDQLVDIAGNGEIYIVNGSLQQLTRGRSSLKLKVTMVSVVSVSEVALNIAGKTKTRAHLYDRDKQAWLMEADTTGKNLTFRLYYTDITHVPRKYSRYVCWNVLVLTRYIPDHKVKTNYGPFSRYYVQQDLDEGHLITTSIPVDELQDENCLYTEPDDPRITVHIEWVDSHLLAMPAYHAYDDVDKLQKHQMRREIMALQSENYVLEKQLYSYQVSLSKTTDKLSEQDATTVPNHNHVSDKYNQVSDKNSHVSDKSNHVSDKYNQVSDKYNQVSDKNNHVSDKYNQVSDKYKSRDGGHRSPSISSEKQERTERRSSRDELPSQYDRPRSEGSRRNSTRGESRDKSYDRGSYDRTSGDRMSYRYR